MSPVILAIIGGIVVIGLGVIMSVIDMGGKSEKTDENPNQNMKKK